MLRRHKGLTAAVATAGTLLSLLAAGPVTSASAAPAWRNHVCHGTVRHPGHLIGVNLNVWVRGVCLVDRGPVAVSRNIFILRHSSLLAAFGRHHSRLAVGGSIIVHKGGTLIMGCEPREFACLDSRHPKHSRLFSHSSVGGSIIGLAALGIVVHASHINGNVDQRGGGGGLTCHPQGIFAVHHSPAYSDYEDSFIRGNVRIMRVRSCWLGVIRDFIASSASINHNRMKDPDAMEVVSNVVLRNLICFANHPKVQFGDSHGKPNRVGRHAAFECSFRRLVPNPAGQHHHFSHISVHLH